MSLEKVFKTAQAVKLVTADVKNKNTEDLHKMCTTNQSLAEIQKGKSLCFGSGEKWYERRIQCPAWGKKLVLNVKKKKRIFREKWKRNKKNEQPERLSHYMQVPDTLRYTLIYDKFQYI